MDKKLFTELGLSPELLLAIQDLGFEQPSPIQAQAIPPGLEGRDVVGQSQTGSGKTLAFGLPVLQGINENLRQLQALILCPTRELAMQVCGELHKAITHKPLVKIVPVYGGSSYERQIRSLRDGAQIVVGTPGRVIDLMEKGALKLGAAKYLVLDEADEMLNMGFREAIEAVMEQIPAERQTLFFSATIPPAINALIKRCTKDPVFIRIEQKALTVPTVEQRYYDVKARSKLEVLSRILDLENPRLAIIFANTKRTVDDVTDSLLARGYTVDRLHGDLSQQLRERVMRNFRNGTVEILAATDVAGRGLDVEEVDMVVNYELPYDEEDYVHRIGRTGRAGRFGKAISLVAGKEVYQLQRIQRYTNSKIERTAVPTQEQVEEKRSDMSFEKLRTTLEGNEYTKHEATIERLLDHGFSATDICNAAMHLWTAENTRDGGEQIPEDRPQAAFAPPQQREAAPFRAREGQPDGETRASFFDRPKANFGARDREQPAGPPRERENFDRGPDRGEQYGPPRGEERERIPRPPRGNPDEFATLFLNIGSLVHIQAKDIVGMMYNEVEVESGSLGRVEIFPKHTLLQIRPNQVEQALAIIPTVRLRGKEVRAEMADPSRMGGPGQGERRGGGDFRSRQGGGYDRPQRRY